MCVCVCVCVCSIGFIYYKGNFTEECATNHYCAQNSTRDFTGEISSK